MPRAAAFCLLALLALAACGRQSAARDAETQALRDKVERLEREAAEDRDRLAADLSALHAALDEANSRLAVLATQDPSQNATAARPSTSPRAALRESLRGVMDMSRQALNRLNKSLERSLSRSHDANATARPEP